MEAFALGTLQQNVLMSHAPCSVIVGHSMSFEYLTNQYLEESFGHSASNCFLFFVCSYPLSSIQIVMILYDLVILVKNNQRYSKIVITV